MKQFALQKLVELIYNCNFIILVVRDWKSERTEVLYPKREVGGAEPRPRILADDIDRVSTGTGFNSRKLLELL